MNFLEFLKTINNEYAAILSFACSLLLLIVTIVYAWLTRKNVKEVSRATSLTTQPCVLVSINSCHIFASDPEWNRRQARIEFSIINVGNDPAINVYCFCQCITQNKDKGKKIRANHDAAHWSHILPGETKEGAFVYEIERFREIFDDMCIGMELNVDRLRRGGHEGHFPGTVLRVDSFCFNVPGTVFKSEAYQELGWFVPECIDTLPKSHNLNEHTAPPNELKDEWSYDALLSNPMFMPTKMVLSSVDELRGRIDESHVGNQRAFPEMV